MWDFGEKLLSLRSTRCVKMPWYYCIGGDDYLHNKLGKTHHNIIKREGGRKSVGWGRGNEV